MQEEVGREAAGTCAIAVMAKASIPGRSKTRLVPPLTPPEAADLNTMFLRDAADSILAAAQLASVKGWMAYAPAGSGDFFKNNLPASISLIETVAPDLGACLLRAAQTLLSAGHAAVCLINSDSPTLPVGHLVAAAAALATPGDRIVLGPATDGGYYLIGMKQPHHGLFKAIDWSTDGVFRQTLDRAEQLALPVYELPAWYDVDDAATLRVLVGELLEGRPYRTGGSKPAAATWTQSYLANLQENADLAARLDGAQPSSCVA